MSQRARKLDTNEGLRCLHSHIFATILETTIIQMNVLKEANNLLTVKKATVYMNLLKSMKYGAKPELNQDDTAKVNLRNLSDEKYKLNKLSTDRNYIIEAIKTLYVELTLGKSYKSLEARIVQIMTRKNLLYILTEDERRNSARYMELRKELKRKVLRHKIAVHAKDIDSLYSELEDHKSYTTICDRYVVNWQLSRAEQHNLDTRNNEIQNEDIVENYKLKHDYEHRIHMEVDSFTGIAIHDTLQKIEDCITKYENDMEAIELKIQIQKNEYLVARDKRRRLEDKIEKHDQLIKACINVKEEREKARQYLEKMTKSVITVQAWWRGLLVRLMLGPNRPPKHKKGIRRNKFQKHRNK